MPRGARGSEAVPTVVVARGSDAVPAVLVARGSEAVPAVLVARGDRVPTVLVLRIVCAVAEGAAVVHALPQSAGQSSATLMVSHRGPR